MILAMLAIKAYVRNNKINSAKMLPTVGIEPGTLGFLVLLSRALLTERRVARIIYFRENSNVSQNKLKLFHGCVLNRESYLKFISQMNTSKTLQSSIIITGGSY